MSPLQSPIRSPSPYCNHNTTSNTTHSHNETSNHNIKHHNTSNTNNNNAATSSVNVISSGGSASSSFLRADRARTDGRGLAKYLRSEYKETHQDKGLDNKDKGSEKDTNNDKDKDKDVDQTALRHSTQSNLTAPRHSSQSNLTAPRHSSQSNLTAPRPPSQISSQELLAKALAKLQASISCTPSTITRPTYLHSTLTTLYHFPIHQPSLTFFNNPLTTAQASNKVRRSVLALRPSPPPPPQLQSQLHPSSQSQTGEEERGDGESKGTSGGSGLGLGEASALGLGIGQGQGLRPGSAQGPGFGSGLGLGRRRTLEDRLRSSLEGLCGYRGEVGADDDDVDKEEEEEEEEKEKGDEHDEEKNCSKNLDLLDKGQVLAPGQGPEGGSLRVLQGSALWRRLARRRQPKGAYIHTPPLFPENNI